jgi:hypothetical protein
VGVVDEFEGGFEGVAGIDAHLGARARHGIDHADGDLLGLSEGAGGRSGAREGNGGRAAEKNLSAIEHRFILWRLAGFLAVPSVVSGPVSRAECCGGRRPVSRADGIGG